MKYAQISSPLLFLSAVLIGIFWCTQEVDARIGERRETIERRLFDSGGIIYRDDVIQRNRMQGMPYNKYMDYLSGSAEVRVYFKTADGRSPSSSELEEKQMGEGWDMHVLYVNGKSVMEVYKRSQAMSEHERNYLLVQQGQGSFWKRFGKNERAEIISAIGIDMERDDGKVRAKTMGRNSIAFIDSEIDENLAKLNESDLQKKAPISVDGF